MKFQIFFFITTLVAMTMTLVTCKLLIDDSDPNDYPEVRKLMGAGSNRFGQLGQFDSTLFTKIPFRFNPPQPSEIEKFCIVNHDNEDTEIPSFTNYEPNGYHGIVISRGDLNVYTWGFGSPGQGSIERLDPSIHEKSPKLLCNLKELTGDNSTSVKSLTCGRSGTIIVTSDNKVVVFGSHKKGLLGIGTNVTYTSVDVVSPMRSTTLESLNLEKIWAVGERIFAVSKESISYGFGDNSFGQLGFASTPGESTYYYTPVPILQSLATEDRVLQSVSGGLQYTIMLTSTGKVFGCGLDQSGLNLGLGETSTISRYNPQSIYNATKVKFIASMGATTVTLDEGNVLRAWGANAHQQLCIATTNLNIPTQVSNLTVESSVGKMAMVNNLKLSRNHIIVQYDDTEFMVCGDNKFGNLGVLDPVTQLPPIYLNSTSWMKLSRFSTESLNLVDLTVIDSNVFILDSLSHTVYGYGDLSRIPNVPVVYSSLVEIKVGNDLLVEKVAASEFVSAAVEKDTGKLYLWGGQRYPIAFLTGGKSYNHIYTPLLFPELRDMNVSSIVIGAASQTSADISTNDQTGYSSIAFYALMNNTRQLYSWGTNDYFQLGRTANDTRKFEQLNFTPTKFNLPTNFTRVEKMVASGRHFVALTFEDTGKPVVVDPLDPFAKRTVFDLAVIGSNKLGSLGLNSSASDAPTVIRPFSNARDCAVGDFHTTYLNTKYQTYGTGHNNDGRTGIGALQASTKFNIGAIGPFVEKVFAGAKTGFFIATNGTVYASGDNTFGQLGFPKEVTKVIFPTIVPGLPEILKVASAQDGGAHTLFLAVNGSVYATGKNDQGQLALGDTVTRFGVVQVPIPNGLTGLEVSTGKDHSLILVGARVCPNQCSGRGVCNRALGVCSCGTSQSGDQYVGFDCSFRQCADPTCSGHGTCDLDRGICKCQTKYKGAKCDQIRCLNNCSGANRGTCNVARGTCDCNPNGQFTGLDCSIYNDASTITKRSNTIAIMFIASVIAAFLF